MLYHFELGGGLGDVFMEIYRDGHYNALAEMGEEDRACGLRVAQRRRQRGARLASGTGSYRRAGSRLRPEF